MSTVLNPATEEPLAELDAAGVEETDEAVARAKAAYPAWRAVAPPLAPPPDADIRGARMAKSPSRSRP